MRSFVNDWINVQWNFTYIPHICRLIFLDLISFDRRSKNLLLVSSISPMAPERQVSQYACNTQCIVANDTRYAVAVLIVFEQIHRDRTSADVRPRWSAYIVIHGLWRQDRWCGITPSPFAEPRQCFQFIKFRHTTQNRIDRSAQAGIRNHGQRRC